MESSAAVNILKMVGLAVGLAVISAFIGWHSGAVAHNLLNPPVIKKAPLITHPVQKRNPLPMKKAEKKPEKTTRAKVMPVEKKMPERPAPKKAAPKTPPLPPPVPAVEPISSPKPVKAPSAGVDVKIPEEKESRPTMESGPNTLLVLGADRFDPPVSPGMFSIRTGIYRVKKYADLMAETLMKKGYSPTVVVLPCKNGSKVYAVTTGWFGDRASAQKALGAFKRKEGMDAVLTAIKNMPNLSSFCGNQAKREKTK